ncbi:acid protease [Obba rivulosa]|uniref:Acid protease n=1 Tax=Obba rivulosa TaxID=1052685 RepID=A0A8E2ATS8_9APHY|nr:acid protease [Obba rivulosa]
MPLTSPKAVAPVTSLAPPTLPITRLRSVTGASSIVEKDRARDQALRSRPQPAGPGKQQSAPATVLNANVTDSGDLYLATIGVGNPPTQYTVILDTGSSNTWVGANQKYVKTSTSQPTGQQVEVSYGSGAFKGQEYTDTVTIAPGLAVQKQSIGVATFAEGLNGLDGIMGIGPTDLTQGTLQNQDATIPTVVDNAFTQNLISAKQVGISFEPTTSASETNGEVSFGGPDPSRFTGSIAYVPITSTSPANAYVGIDQSITYGSSQTPILSKTAGIVDTGTSLLMLATDALQRYVHATGATMDNNTGLYALPADQFGNLESLFFNIGNITYEFTPDAQIWPRALNSKLGGTDDNVYLVVGDNGSNSGSGLDFTNGLAWLERFYFVYDSGNNQVGFANTPFTNVTSNSGN